MLIRSAIGLTAAVVLVGLAGCGERGPEFADVVEGTVTLHGKPLEKVRVDTTPSTAGPRSTALTDAQGRFSLRTIDDERQGAVLGKHKVVVTDVSIYSLPFRGKRGDPEDLTQGKKPRIAAKYSNDLTTPLEIDVTGDTRDVTLEVEPYGSS